MKSTLILSKTEVEEMMDEKKLLYYIKKGFLANLIQNSTNNSIEKYQSTLNSEMNSVVVLFPGILDGIPAYTIKIHAKNPNQSPSIKGVIQLNDINTGDILAIMDSTYITAIRTGISGALGTHIVANPNYSKVTIIGAGIQGEIQLKSLLKFRKISKVTVYDLDIEKSERFVGIFNDLNIPIIIAKSVDEALHKAEIVITATWSTKPFIQPELLQHGAHITTLGSDEKGKVEVSAEVIKKSFFVCDSKKLALSVGVIGSLGINPNCIDAELGFILKKPLKHPIEKYNYTIYHAVGMPFQDLAAAWIVYKKAKNAQKGHSLNFLK